MYGTCKQGCRSAGPYLTSHWSVLSGVETTLQPHTKRRLEERLKEVTEDDRFLCEPSAEPSAKYRALLQASCHRTHQSPAAEPAQTDCGGVRALRAIRKEPDATANRCRCQHRSNLTQLQGRQWWLRRLMRTFNPLITAGE